MNGGRPITPVITYPTEEMRDHVLGIGMVTGIEASSVRTVVIC